MPAGRVHKLKSIRKTADHFFHRLLKTPWVVILCLITIQPHQAHYCLHSPTRKLKTSQRLSTLYTEKWRFQPRLQSTTHNPLLYTHNPLLCTHLSLWIEVEIDNEGRTTSYSWTTWTNIPGTAPQTLFCQNILWNQASQDILNLECYMDPR